MIDKYKNLTEKQKKYFWYFIIGLIYLIFFSTSKILRDILFLVSFLYLLIMFLIGLSYLSNKETREQYQKYKKWIKLSVSFSILNLFLYILIDKGNGTPKQNEISEQITYTNSTPIEEPISTPTPKPKLTQKQIYDKLSNIKAKDWNKLNNKTKNEFLYLYAKSLSEEDLNSVITKIQLKNIEKYKNNKTKYYNLKLNIVVENLRGCIKGFLEFSPEIIKELEKEGMVTTLKVTSDTCMRGSQNLIEAFDLK